PWSLSGRTSSAALRQSMRLVSVHSAPPFPLAKIGEGNVLVSQKLVPDSHDHGEEQDHGSNGTRVGDGAGNDGEAAGSKASMKKLRFAVIGAGFWAPFQL